MDAAIPTPGKVGATHNNPLKLTARGTSAGLVLALVGVAATLNLGLGPRWYPISLAALAILQCWAGGKIYEMQSGRQGEGT